MNNEHYCSFCQPKDIVGRMIRKGIWDIAGSPKVTIKGSDGEFGELYIDLGYRTIYWRIRLIDIQKIKNAAEMAILNYAKYAPEVYDE